MRFFADLHIHSRFSRATSKSLTLRALAEGAARKGIAVLGTGDFTHPAWFGEIGTELVEAEPGLFRLKDGSQQARFMLTSEISTIYKQDGKVRKVHHLIGAPDLECARKISTSLARVGNILSDGRPILGITSRNLLEIVLEASGNAFLIPAHIWNPWFSVLGSKSGFDTVKECYADLAPYIFAVETGLSSDPPMNWMVTSLDRYHLVSNSDAHSAEKLGREATIFGCGLHYLAMRHAMETGVGLVGTVEFFPEEGKYHLDGHRDCGVVLTPEETKEYGGMCPVCGRKVTVGVLSRVEELADRRDGAQPASGRPFFSLIPLQEILGEIMQTGSSSKKVLEAYDLLIARLGGELPLLMDVDPAEIRSVGGETLSLAITRMRQGQVHKEAGYDGSFGRIRVFRDDEDLLFSGSLFGRPLARPKKKAGVKAVQEEVSLPPLLLNRAQEEVIAWRDGNLCVTAGPGTGKTRALVQRIKALIERGERSILAVTFTVKAGREIKERLGACEADVLTFHGLAARILKESGIDFHIADDAMIEEVLSGWCEEKPGPLVADMLLRQSTGRPLDPGPAHLLDSLRREGYYTYEGLIEEAMRLIGQGCYAPPWSHVMVDEFQDINPLQYEFLKCLSRGAKSLMVIGDPNQAIYGFRGSSPESFDDFRRDFPDVKTVGLTQTYRLHDLIASGSNAFIGHQAVTSPKKGSPIRVVKTFGAGDFIAREIESLSGGLSHRGVSKAKADYSLSDIAVIVRTQHQARPVTEALGRASIPYDAAYARPLASVNGISQRVALLERQGWQTLIRGVGPRSLEKAGMGGKPDADVSRKLDRADALLAGLKGPITDRLESIEASGLFKLPELGADHAFYQYARMFGQDVEGFIRFLKLSHDQDALMGEKVRILTAHAAKGLEFKCVFIAGLAEGAFPLADEDASQERNLFYVAMTRAANLLYLVCPPGAASSFVAGIPTELCTVEEESRKQRSEQMLLFEG